MACCSTLYRDLWRDEAERKSANDGREAQSAGAVQFRGASTAKPERQPPEEIPASFSRGRVILTWLCKNAAESHRPSLPPRMRRKRVCAEGRESHAMLRTRGAGGGGGKVARRWSFIVASTDVHSQHALCTIRTRTSWPGHGSPSDPEGSSVCRFAVRSERRHR